MTNMGISPRQRLFNTEIVAAIAFNAKAIELYGTFAHFKYIQ
jgi:hypothetical protein